MNKSQVITSLAISNVFLVSLLYLSNYWHLHWPGKTIPRGQINFENEYVNPFQIYEDYPIDLVNASAIFNTVHGALKQKDANLNPVGVSFIPAYIPPNTRFYHSTGLPEIPELFEWIAMEYEFSYAFAQFQKPPNGTHPPFPKKPPPGAPPPFAKKPPPSDTSDKLKFLPFFDNAYLYSFRTTRALDKVILLDGASAAKYSPLMDQQMILSRQENTSAPVNERIAAEKICNWGQSFGLQGIIRLEIGFEIIICDFQRDLELISNVTLDTVIDTLSLPSGSDESAPLINKFSAQDSFENLRMSSYVNNGDRRIKLDLSKMVTPLNKTYIDPNPFARNISYIDNDLKEDIISELETFYTTTKVDPYETTDWQVVTGLIENKFGPLFDSINKTFTYFNGSHSSLQVLGENLLTLTFNFQRRYNDMRHYDDRQEYAFNSSILDYVHHTYPLQHNDILIYSSIFKVQYEISTMMFDIYNLGRDIVDNVSDIDVLKQRVTTKQKKLIDFLNVLRWSIFVDCTEKCGLNSVCYVPTWGPSPFGWGQRNEKFFDNIDGVYSISKNLQCVDFDDILSLRHRW